MLEQNLTNFLDKHRDYIKEVSGLLAHSLPDEPVPMIEQTKLLIGHRARIATLLAEMNALLDLAEYESLPQKTRNVTELDRTTEQKKQVRDYRMWRDILYGIMSSIDSTRSWAQSALAFEKTHASFDGEGA